MNAAYKKALSEEFEVLLDDPGDPDEKADDKSSGAPDVANGNTAPIARTIRTCSRAQSGVMLFAMALRSFVFSSLSSPFGEAQ